MRLSDRARPSDRGTIEQAAPRAPRWRMRHRAALGPLATAGAAIALAAAGCGGSSHPASSKPAAPLAAAGASGAGRGLPARGGAGSGTGAGTGTGAGSAESAQVRRLIALGKPIYCAGPRGDEVALTFDDGPGPYTRLVLAKLRKHGAAATFFDVGRNIGLVAHATREEQAIGALGDHTFNHPLLTSLAPGDAESEIARTQAALTRSSGGKVFLFRPPYGARNATIDRIVREHGMLQILWTVDSGDSLGANYAQIERNVIGGLRPGAIILMHENHGQTVRALLKIFDALRRRHLRAVSVPQLLTDDPPSLAQVRAGGAGCGIRGRAALGGG